MEDDRTVVRIISEQSERVPFARLNVGDAIIDDKGIKRRIVAKTVRLWELDTGCRFSSPLHAGWFMVWIHGSAIFGLPVLDGPFGGLREESEIIIPFPEQEVLAVLFEPITSQ